MHGGAINALKQCGGFAPAPRRLNHSAMLYRSTDGTRCRNAGATFCLSFSLRRGVSARAQKAMVHLIRSAQVVPDSPCSSTVLRWVGTVLLIVEAKCLADSHAKASHWHLCSARVRHSVQVQPRSAIHLVAAVATQEAYKDVPLLFQRSLRWWMHCFPASQTFCPKEAKQGMKHDRLRAPSTPRCASIGSRLGSKLRGADMTDFPVNGPKHRPHTNSCFPRTHFRASTER